MKVLISMPLRSYTGRQRVIEASGTTIREMPAEMDRRYPGFRFCIIDEQDGIREQSEIFLNEEPISTLSTPTQPTDTVHICALSGGV